MSPVAGTNFALGSNVLDPLLSLLYINDLPKCPNILDFHLVADDTNLFLDNTQHSKFRNQPKCRTR